MADQPAPTPEAPAAAAPAQPSMMQKVMRLLPKVAILGGLAAAAFALVLFVVRPMFPAPNAPNAPEKAPEHKAEKFGKVVALDSVVVNVAQTEGRRYLKATVHLEVADEEKIVKEVEARKAQLLDVIVATLTRKSLAELTSPEALDTLRGEVLTRVSQALGAERVRRVYITEFVVQ